MSSFKWISEGLKSLRLSKSIVGGARTSKRGHHSSFLANAAALPPKPKRPASGFVRFSMIVREDVKKENPNLKPPEIMKVCAQRWNSLPDSQKESYSKSYQSELAQFAREMTEYKNSLTPDQVQQMQQAHMEKNLRRQKIELRHKLEALDKPKRPANPFMQFIQEHMAKGTQSGNLKGMVKELAQKWKAMTPEAKAPYVAKHKEAKEKYEKLMTQWEAKMMKMGQEDVVRQDTVLAVRRNRLIK